VLEEQPTGQVTDRRVRTADLWTDPYPTFATLRRHAPVSRLGDDPPYLVSTWALVADAVGRVQDFSNHFRYSLFDRGDGTLAAIDTGGAGPDVFAGADPPVHSEHRRIFSPSFAPREVQALEPYVARLAHELLDVLLLERRCDAAEGLCHPLPTRVVAERVIGFRDADTTTLRQWIAAGSRLAGGMLTIEELAARRDEVAGMAPWVAAQLDRELATPTVEGLLGVTATAVRHGSLSREEAVFNLMVLLGAGAETTTSLIGIAVAALARDPELQSELRVRKDKVPAFVEEVLRFDAPFRYHPRTAVRTCELGGVAIPRGSLVLLLWASANRDPAVFNDPDRIVLDRPNAHLHFGFGRGTHHCVGAALARLEARVVLEQLLARTKEFVLDPNQPEQWHRSVWVHGHDRLPLLVDPR
jgi:cytochrome P450